MPLPVIWTVLSLNKNSTTHSYTVGNSFQFCTVTWQRRHSLRFTVIWLGARRKFLANFLYAHFKPVPLKYENHWHKGFRIYSANSPGHSKWVVPFLWRRRPHTRRHRWLATWRRGWTHWGPGTSGLLIHNPGQSKVRHYGCHVLLEKRKEDDV